MINLQEIDEEINKILNNGRTSQANINDLAALITVKNYMSDAGEDAIGFQVSGTGRRTGTQNRRGVDRKYSGREYNEIDRITDRMNRDEIRDAYREHMNETRLRHPTDYDAEIERIRNRYS